MKAYNNIGIAILLFLCNVYGHGQSLKASKDYCLVEITLTDFKDYPIIYCDLICKTEPQGDIIKAQTDKLGKAIVLIPKKNRKSYSISCNYRGDKFEFDRVFKIPEDEGAYTLTVNLQYQSKYLVLYEVEFETGNAKLKEESFKELNRIIEMLSLKPGMVIEISGHTDSIGNLDYNMKLSEKRAHSVKDYLISNEINGERIYAKGYGPTIPISPNDSEEGRQRNRRIEVKIIKE
jgi:outer membrane protein OmpA-like peptidoglycan-associated protein